MTADLYPAARQALFGDDAIAAYRITGLADTHPDETPGMGQMLNPLWCRLAGLAASKD